MNKTTGMDEQLCMLGFGVSLPEKIEKAIGNFRAYEPEALRHDPENGFYLCDSYGKDSCVIRDLAKRSGVRFVAHHNLTTIDPPELIQFGKKHHADTVVHRPAVPMLVRLADKSNGPPTRIGRWCCAEYKESGGLGKVKVFGVRAAESARRKANWKVWQPTRGDKSWILNPVLYWTDDDVWTYIRQNNLPYCSLYDEGKRRLGCIGCPMNTKGRKDDFKRWPKYELLWKKAVQKFWENWHGVPRRDGKPRWFDVARPGGKTMQSWQDLWDWWIEETETPEEEDECQMGLF